MSSPLRLGIAGLGTVGIGVVKIVQKHADLLAMRSGRPVAITAVSARDRMKNRDADLSSYRWEADPMAVATAEDVDVFIELVGGDAQFESQGRDFLAWRCLAYAFVLSRRIWVLPGAGAQFCVVHGRVGHVNFGLVEANIHHIIKNWDVGGRWEVQRLGRRGRKQGYFAAQLRLVGVVSRCHVWIRQGAEGAARG